MYESVDDYCVKSNILIKKNVELSTISYSATGKNVDRLFYPSSNNQLIDLIKILNKKDYSYRIIGETTNLLFLDSVSYSIFISTKLIDCVEFLADRQVKVECGRKIPVFVRDVSAKSYTGFEGLEGIPGSVGGAIIMNAGAYGNYISDNLISVEVLSDCKSFVEVLTKEECLFSTRSAINLSGRVVLSATFSLQKGNAELIERKIRKFHISRHLYQEWVYPNLGSIFILLDENIHYKLINSKHFKSRSNLFYKIYIDFIVALLKTKVGTLFRRAKPLFSSYEFLLKTIFPEVFESKIRSRCTINTFANRDKSSFDILRYIYSVKKFSNDLKLENEIALDSISKVINKDEYKKCLNLVKKIAQR